MAAPSNEHEMHHAIVQKLRQEFRDQFKGAQNSTARWPAYLPAAGELCSSGRTPDLAPSGPIPQNFAWSECDEALPLPPPAPLAVDLESLAPRSKTKIKTTKKKPTVKTKKKAGKESAQPLQPRGTIPPSPASSSSSPSRRPAWAQKTALQAPPPPAARQGDVEVDSFGDPISDNGDDISSPHDLEEVKPFGDAEIDGRDEANSEEEDSEQEEEEEDDDENTSPVSVALDPREETRNQRKLRHLKSSVFDAFDPSLQQEEPEPFRPTRKPGPLHNNSAALRPEPSILPFPMEPEATGLLSAQQEASAAKVTASELDTVVESYASSATFKEYLSEHISPGTAATAKGRRNGGADWVGSAMRSPLFKKWLRQRPPLLLSFVGKRHDHVAVVLRLYRDSCFNPSLQRSAVGGGHNHLGHHYRAPSAQATTAAAVSREGGEGKGGGGRGGKGARPGVRFAEEREAEEEKVEVDSFGDPISEKSSLSAESQQDEADGASGRPRPPPPALDGWGARGGGEDFAEFEADDDDGQDEEDGGFYAGDAAAPAAAAASSSSAGFGPNGWGDPQLEAAAAAKGHGKKRVPPGTTDPLTAGSSLGEEEGEGLAAAVSGTPPRGRQRVAGKATEEVRALAESPSGGRRKAKPFAHERALRQRPTRARGGVMAPTQSSLKKAEAAAKHHRVPRSEEGGGGACTGAGFDGRPRWVGVRGIHSPAKSTSSPSSSPLDREKLRRHELKEYEEAEAAAAAVGGARLATTTSKWATNRTKAALSRKNKKKDKNFLLDLYSGSKSPILANERWGDLKPQVRNSTEYTRNFAWKQMR